MAVPGVVACWPSPSIKAPSSSAFTLDHPQPAGWVSQPGSGYHRKTAACRSRQKKVSPQYSLLQSKETLSEVPIGDLFHISWTVTVPHAHQNLAPLVTLATCYQHQREALSQEGEEMDKQHAVPPHYLFLAPVPILLPPLSPAPCLVSIEAVVVQHLSTLGKLPLAANESVNINTSFSDAGSETFFLVSALCCPFAATHLSSQLYIMNFIPALCKLQKNKYILQGRHQNSWVGTVFEVHGF